MAASHAVDVSGFLDAGIASLTAHRAYLAGLGTVRMPRPWSG